jgi:hypothetical protein
LDTVQELAVDRVDVNGAVFLGVEYYRVQRVGGDQGKVQR